MKEGIIRTPKKIGERQKANLKELLIKARSKTDFQRILSVWLRASLNLSSKQIAKGIGWNPGTVRRIQSEYLRKGEMVLIGEKRGGRRRENMSLEAEKKLLRIFQQRAKKGEILKMVDIKIVYEHKIGHAVSNSTIYRLLSRHGLKKIINKSQKSYT